MERKRPVFRLFIDGSSRSDRATVEALTRLCRRYFGNDYELEVVDVREHPSEAEQTEILATPTLIRVSPEPSRRIIGDLTDMDMVAAGLDLQAG